MRLSIFTTLTNPRRRGDNVNDALKCYADLSDELVIVNTGIEKYSADKIVTAEWPTEFVWPIFGRNFQRGYEACTGDWILKADIDYIFHENDHLNIRKELARFSEFPAVTFFKRQFILPDRFNVKSRLAIAINKKAFGDRIRFDSGGDLCQPSLDGTHLKSDNIPNLKIPFWNYEKLLKTKEQIAEDQGRMERAWFRHFGEYQMKSDGTDESAYERWIEAQRGKFAKPQQKVSLEAHPRYIQETIRGLKPENFGCNGFGLIDGRVYA